MSDARLDLNRRQYLELEKLGLGAFQPLTAFMSASQFHSVTDSMSLPGGEPFTLPVVLDLDDAAASRISRSRVVSLAFNGRVVGRLHLSEVYAVDKPAAAEKIYGTADTAHAGVAHFYRMGSQFAAGEVELLERVDAGFGVDELTPQQTRRMFADRGWQTIAGFQTRNVPHRAHEYLQRLALESLDGLFIQPLVGAKKRGDYAPEAVLAGYRALLDRFLPRDRVLFGILTTAMRYAGPREAVFHAIIRRNYGCTHFIVGRDHAGVGGFYGKYDAHALTRQFDGRLGITILRMHGPFHCAICDGIVTERTCPHEASDPDAITEVSGTLVRAMLANGNRVRPELLRPYVAASLEGLPLFIEEDQE
jgi:sulfate adenylyltransferase